MIGRVYDEFRRILQAGSITPERVLEVGGLPDQRAVLACTELEDVPIKCGINLRKYGFYAGIPIVGGDARHLPFEDRTFDLVLSNSTLEHIPDFWRAAEEMRRVLAPGGTMVVGMPGYAESSGGNAVRRWATRLGLPDFFRRATVTMRIHASPHDYYRFSRYSLRQVILGGMREVSVWTIMNPPRVFGIGVK